MSDRVVELIVNADDLGASPGINAGIEEAVVAGIVTSASLMVNMPGAAGGADLGRRRPRLSVGLHVNLTNETGPPIADFDDAAACAAEIDRQLDRFGELVGGPPTHLDAHHNVHRDPRLEPLFVDAARRLGIPLREHGPVRYFPDFYGQWDDETHPEWISVENLLRMVDGLGSGPTELACHPGRPEPDFVSAYHAERAIELTTLLTPGLPEQLASRGVMLRSYHDVGS